MRITRVVNHAGTSKLGLLALALVLAFVVLLTIPRLVLPEAQAMLPGVAGCRSFEQFEDVPGCKVSAEYTSKHMPKGGWTNPEMIAKGEVIFQAVCAVCHGPEGKPKLVGARNFRDEKKMNKFTDSYWFWRISEGVPGTKMPPWQSALTEEQRWHVMAYEHRNPTI